MGIATFTALMSMELSQNYLFSNRHRTCTQKFCDRFECCLHLHVMMGTAFSSKTLVSYHITTWYQNPETVTWTSSQ